MTLQSFSRGSTLRLPDDPAWIRMALDHVQDMAAVVGFDPAESNKIRLATEDVLEFFFRVASGDPSAPPVLLHLTPAAHEITICIETMGMPFDIHNLPEFMPESALESSDPESSDLDGLNLYLARWAVDRVVFHNLGRGGIKVELLKQHPCAHVRETPESPGVETTCDPVTHIPVDDFTIRPFKPSEAVEISRCAYLTYGHSYEDFIYYPEKIVEMNRLGQLHSLVTVSPDGAIMGHCGLKCVPGYAGRAELGVLFVRPQYRRNNVGGALWQSVINLARQKNFASIIARSVTGHKASQRLAKANRFLDMCLFLAFCPPNVELKSIGGTHRGKMSLMLQWLPLKQPRRRSVHPPRRYAEIVAALYQQAGIPICSAAAAPPPLTEENPLLHSSRILDLNIGILEVESLGNDPTTVSNWISHYTRNFCRDKADTIYLFLNIEQSGCATIADICADRGYLFAGVSPDAFPGADALVMQYINIPGDPFDQLEVLTDTARLLRDFIQAEWTALES